MVCFSLTLLFGMVHAEENMGSYWGGLANQNRTINGLLGITLTTVSLVVPLTSNLYTPRLVRLFISHPFLISGLVLLLCNHLLVFTQYLFATNAVVSHWITSVVTALTIISILGVIPYLYIVSQFLRPSYFINKLSQKAISCLDHLDLGRPIEKNVNQIMGLVDVLSNIAQKGALRGDHQLILFSLRSLSDILRKIMDAGHGEQDWRFKYAMFGAGLARKGQDFLKSNGTWPEAYILAHCVQVMEHADQRQHDILAELGRFLIEGFKDAAQKNHDDIIELLITVFNALMRQAIDRKDLRKFQNLSNHYRELIEILAWNPRWMAEVARHLIHYAELAQKSDMFFAKETVIYDIGTLCLQLEGIERHLGSDFLQSFAGNLWIDAIQKGGGQEKAAWQSMLIVYWEAMALDYQGITTLLKDEYMFDNESHRKYLDIMLRDNRPLHWEFNDRLVRFSYITEKAEALAWEFLSQT